MADHVKNILLVTFDQWRGDCLSVMGHPVLKTPVLDALAADGVLFRNHWTVTCPCGPSRASLLTGTYLNHHRSLHNGTPLSSRFTNIALEARKKGYEPALFGYTDTSADPASAHQQDPVFSSYEGILPGMLPVCRLDDDLGVWLADLKAKGYRIDSPWDVFRPRDDALHAVREAGHFHSRAPASHAAADSNAAFLTGEFLKYRVARGDRPWFAHLSYISPHPPYIAPDPFHEAYDPAVVPPPHRAATPEQEATTHPWLAHYLSTLRSKPLSTDRNLIGTNICLADMSDADMAQLTATYWGMINEVEANFSRVIDDLKSCGQYDETLIILTSDHGDQMGDHWLLGKQGFFDQSYHIPLIIRDPRHAAKAAHGRRVDAFTESVDIMPTILDALGMEIPRQCDGIPLSAWLEGRDPGRWRDHAHFEYDFGDPVHRDAERALGLRSDQCSLGVIRDRHHKYVHFQALPPLLFDLSQDPGELVNRVDDPAYGDVALAMAREMLSWRMSTDERIHSLQHIEQGIFEAADDRFTGL